MDLSCAQITQPVKKKLLTFSWEELHAFDINHFTEGLRFTKQNDGRWFVQVIETDLQKQIAAQPAATQIPKLANREKITAFLTELALIDIGEPVATNTAPAVFHINPQSLHIVFYGPNQEILQKLFIGKKGSDPFSTYVMPTAANDVYWVEKDVRTQTLQPIDTWLDP